MAEKQGVVGDAWNRGLNRFLREVMRWKQLGRSNNDISCDEIKRDVGNDSIFSYKRNPQCNQQVVLVEAKTYERMDSFSRSDVQNWVTRFITKLDCIPHSSDFHKEFHPDADADYHLGIIGLWVREHETFSQEKLQSWLSQLQLPEKRNPLNICFISNNVIGQMWSIHEKIASLNKREYREVVPYFPDYGDLPHADGSCIPIEVLLSKFIFYKAKKVQALKGGKRSNNYDASLVFYLGHIANYDDFRFIGLALKYFQLLQADEAEIFTLYDQLTLRNHIADFKQEFTDTDTEFVFHKLNYNHDLSIWLEKDD